ncbi:MAG: GNAT family N-acetyltransferase [Rhizobacter sp.]
MNSAGLRGEWMTERLRITPAQAGMADSWAQYYQRGMEDAHLFSWQPLQPGQLTSEWHEKTLNVWSWGSQCDLGYLFALHKLDDPNRLVGLLELIHVTRNGRDCADIGFSIDRAHQGEGLMREALEASIKVFFSKAPFCSLHRLQALVHPSNQRSLKLLSGLGFEHEGVSKQSIFIDGQWHDQLMLALVNKPSLAAQEGLSSPIATDRLSHTE